MSEKSILTADYFSVKIPNRPHIPYLEGGHIFIEPIDTSKSNRYELTPEEHIELAWIQSLTGLCYTETLKEDGIPIYRLNYQDNGNWAFLRGEIPVFHIHIYGRSENERIQRYGEALLFPDHDSTAYDSYEPMPEYAQKVMVEKMIDKSRNSDWNWLVPDRFESMIVG